RDERPFLDPERRADRVPEMPAIIFAKAMTTHCGEHRFVNLTECVAGFQQGCSGLKGLLERFVNLLSKRSRLAIDEGARAIRRITIHKRADIGLDEVAFRQL